MNPPDTSKQDDAAKTVICPACTGRKIISVATEDVRCDACKGTGKVKVG